MDIPHTGHKGASPSQGPGEATDALHEVQS